MSGGGTRVTVIRPRGPLGGGPGARSRRRPRPGPGWWAAGCGLAFAALTWAVVARHGLPFAPDRTVHAWAVAHRPPVVVALAETVAASASGPLPYAAALAAGWAACRTVTWTGRREALTVFGAVAVLALGQIARWTTMRIVARPRPPLADWAAGATGLAYPSGHATTAALTAGLLIWAAHRTAAPRPVLRAASALCAGWALAVGAARISLGVHWPTDVLAGWLFASTWLALTLPPLTRLANRASAR